jgi:hypothetical protein
MHSSVLEVELKCGTCKIEMVEVVSAVLNAMVNTIKRWPPTSTIKR